MYQVIWWLRIGKAPRSVVPLHSFRPRYAHNAFNARQLPLFPYSSKMSALFSIRNCTALFLACMSVISFSRLWSLMMVGANTTAKFLGDIYCKIN